MENKALINKTVLLLVVALISALFLGIIGRFLEAIFLAGLFTAVCYPLYRRFLAWFSQRKALASLATLILVLCFIVIPLVLVSAIVAGQAADFANTASPWLQNVTNDPGYMATQLERMPFYERLLPLRDFIAERLGSIVVVISKTGVGLLQSATVITLNALVTILIVLYCFFFFLMDGDRLLQLILYYLPLDNKNEQLLLSRFRSVTIATLKGTAVIGFLQGALAGLALWFTGIPNALFWSVSMMLLSVIPGIGAALIWIPACLFLAANGDLAAAGGLLIFCSLLVGSVDNVLRPKLVGNDTQLHELMIFFSTLGGLLTFGVSGFIIGPIIAALFVTVWEIYGVEFRHWLPDTEFIPHSVENVLKEARANEENHIDTDRPAPDQYPGDDNNQTTKQKPGPDKS